MEKSDADGLSIQDMRLLQALEVQGTVSGAAEKLGISQSSASYGLDKLRRAFSDPLFVRQGAIMVPTAHGSDVAQYVSATLSRLDVLRRPTQFNPAASKRVFRIAATGYEIFSLLVEAHRALREQAPNVLFHVDEIDNPNAVKHLQKRWDILLSPAPPEAAGIMRRKLFEDRYATFYDPSHQTAPATLKDFTAAPHAIVSKDGDTRTIVEQAIEAQGLTRRIGLIVSSFDHLPAFMKGTPLISTLPARFAQGLFRDFGSIPSPLPMENLSLYMIWSEVHTTDPGHRWLREFLTQQARTNKEI